MIRVKIRYNSPSAQGKILRFDESMKFQALLSKILRKLGIQSSEHDLNQFQLLMDGNVVVEDTSELDDGDDLIVKKVNSFSSEDSDPSIPGKERSGTSKQKAKQTMPKKKSMERKDPKCTNQQSDSATAVDKTEEGPSEEHQAQPKVDTNARNAAKIKNRPRDNDRKEKPRQEKANRSGRRPRKSDVPPPDRVKSLSEWAVYETTSSEDSKDPDFEASDTTTTTSTSSSSDEDSSDSSEEEDAQETVRRDQRSKSGTERTQTVGHGQSTFEADTSTVHGQRFEHAISSMTRHPGARESFYNRDDAVPDAPSSDGVLRNTDDLEAAERQHASETEWSSNPVSDEPTNRTRIHTEDQPTAEEPAATSTSTAIKTEPSSDSEHIYEDTSANNGGLKTTVVNTSGLTGTLRVHLPGRQELATEERKVAHNNRQIPPDPRGDRVATPDVDRILPDEIWSTGNARSAGRPGMSTITELALEDTSGGPGTLRRQQRSESEHRSSKEMTYQTAWKEPSLPEASIAASEPVPPAAASEPVPPAATSEPVPPAATSSNADSDMPALSHAPKRHNVNLNSFVVQAVAGSGRISPKSVFIYQTKNQRPYPNAKAAIWYRCGIQWFDCAVDDEDPRIHWPSANFELWRSLDKPFSSIIGIPDGYRWFASNAEAKMYASLSFILYHKEQFGGDTSLKRFLEIPASPTEVSPFEGIASHCVFVDPTGRKIAVGVRDNDGATGYFLVDEEGNRASEVLKLPILGTATRAGNYANQKVPYRGIIRHLGPFDRESRCYLGCIYNLKVRWSDGSVSNEPLTAFAEDAWNDCVEYARKHNLLSKKGWKFLNGRKNHMRPGNGDTRHNENASHGRGYYVGHAKRVEKSYDRSENSKRPRRF
ncbi:expressed unknown protein [Seminavis robusta]|uniref:Uncharacterized protein n=1 Tax=Seminavis robusta TaxID=568900 RepID=A0A9N8HE73_9STRA|nr:expressed unknown protein [Seminavis robusta]|eukprot:Sro500_g155270.1 n/a (880) ;mRNA; f:26949-29588